MLEIIKLPLSLHATLQFNELMFLEKYFIYYHLLILSSPVLLSLWTPLPTKKIAWCYEQDKNTLLSSLIFPVSLYKLPW